MENARIRSVSLPTLTPYVPMKEQRTGMAVVVCADGDYGVHDWRTHIVYAARVFNRMGVVLIGLKYRTRPPHQVKSEEIQAITLLDAKRAVRLVRHRSAEWGIHPSKIGIVGRKLGVPARLDLFENGGHAVGNLIQTRVAHHFSGAQWPRLLVEWLDTLPQP